MMAYHYGQIEKFICRNLGGQRLGLGGFFVDHEKIAPFSCKWRVFFILFFFYFYCFIF
jgi:hypothetical protein